MNSMRAWPRRICGPGTLARNRVVIPPGSPRSNEMWSGPEILHEGARGAEHPAWRLAEGDRQQAPLLAEALAGAQEEGHPVQRQLSMPARSAMNVSVCETASTPGPSR